MEKLTVVGIIALAILIGMLFIPSVNIYKKVEYDESRLGYGWGTHWMYERGMRDGYLYGVNEKGDLYFVYRGKYEMFVDAPGYMGHEFCNYYLSDSVIYMGDWRGRMYYADPWSGRIIWTLELSRLHIYFNSSHNPDTFYHYHILYGNRSGYFYILFNNTIYHIYRDVKILDELHNDFKGAFIATYPWNGGLILKFNKVSSPSIYDIYYFKDNRILWNLSLRSRMHISYSDVPDIYIEDGLICHFGDSKITVYKDCRKFRELEVPGKIINMEKMGDEFYVFSYSGTKNLWLLYDGNFTFLKKIVLFDLKNIGVKKWDIRNQRASIYENNTGYTVFLYTAPDLCNEQLPYVPL